MTRQISLFVLICVVVASFFVIRFTERPFREKSLCEMEATAESVSRENFAFTIRTQNAVVRFYGEASDLRAGDRIRFRGNCTDVRDREDRYFSQGYSRYLISQGIYYKVYAKELTIVEKRYNRYTLRQDILNFTQRQLEAMYGRETSILKALIYGDRSELSDRMTEDFSKSGTAHILSLSGFHVGILATATNWFFFKVGVKHRGRIVLGVLLFYAFLTGLRPSIVRAVLFFGIYYLSFLRCERFDLFSASCVSASLFLTYNPYYLYDRGFMLSFAGVVSIALFYPMFRVNAEKYLKRDHPLIQLVLFTLSAQVLTMPLCAYYFHRVSWISFLSNLAVLPLISLMMGLALFSLPLHLLSYPFSFFYAMDRGVISAVKFLQKTIFAANDFFANLPYAYSDLAPMRTGTLLMIYFAIFALYLRWEGRMIRENDYEPQRFVEITVEES